jgi:hypothetical protein
MRRLCFLMPDVTGAHAIVDDLRGHGFGDEDIYVIANAETPLGDLPAAGEIEQSDFYPQLRRGLAMGGAIGVIGGLIAIRVAGAVLGGGAVLLFGLIGAGVSGLLAAIAGAAFPNSRLRQFEEAIEAGEVLVMVNVPQERVEEVTALIESRHADIDVEAFEPRTPIIPHR